jgi:hypothetical protein
MGLAALSLTLVVAACGLTGPNPPAASNPASSAPSPAIDLSAIACATADPRDVGELTGAWQGSDRGVYYIRQVGDCVWWFGTELDDIERGVTEQNGFANVASGRLDGTRLEVEWADLPMGDILGGGGLTFMYDAENGQLVLTEQRGDWQPFGGSVLTRIAPSASPASSPVAS